MQLNNHAVIFCRWHSINKSMVHVMERILVTVMQYFIIVILLYYVPHVLPKIIRVNDCDTAKLSLTL